MAKWKYCKRCLAMVPVKKDRDGKEICPICKKKI